MRSRPDSVSVRLPAVAGLFYPADTESLREAVTSLLAQARPEDRCPKALIVPHAGYVYSGEIAASAYGLLRGHTDAIQRVVLLGPAHRVAMRGLAAPMAAAFQTPLGEVLIDREAMEAVADLPGVVSSDAAHELEHCLEVQLPFVQILLPQARIVPLVVGAVGADAVAGVLAHLWGGAETLLIVSSDLSHYHGYGQVQRLDRTTSERILNLDGSLAGDEACGCRAINGLLRLARRRGLHAELVDLRNSGDTGGDKASVVGYGAFAFYEAQAPAGTWRSGIGLT